MKKIVTILAIFIFANTFGQTIDIGPDEYAFRYSFNNNFGLFFNATDVRYEFLNGSATPVFGFSAANGQMTTNLEFNSSADYLVPNNRYAFRAKADSDYGLFFNATSLSYDFRNSSGASSFSIGANSGNLITSGYILPGNTSNTTPGAIRFNGSDLEGRVGGQWKSLTASGGGSGGGSLQDAFEVGNTINTNAEPLLIEGFEGFIVSQGTSASTEGIGVKMFFDPTNISFRCGSVNATAWNDENRGAGSAAFGLSTIASGIGSFAAGNASEASGERAAAFGSQTIASGNFSASFGEGNTASGPFSFAAGEDNTASGQSSAAFGRNSLASGQNSLAFGNNTEASGSNSIVVGSSADATGGASAAFGFSTEAAGFGSIASGWGSSADGDGSVAFGRGTLAKSAYETVIGSWNTDYSANSTTSSDDNDRLFVIGNGTGSSDRNDALVMLKNGFMGLGNDNPSAKLTIDDVPVGENGIRLRGGGNYYSTDNWQFGQAQNETGVTNGDFVMKRVNTPVFHFWNGFMAPVTDNLASLGLPSDRWSTVYASNGTINTSDAREKKNIKEIDYGLETLMKLKPVSYEWKEDAMNMGTKLGFIAQDLLEVVPEVVVTEKRVENRETGAITFEEAERMGVFYDDLIPVLAKAIQEQQGTIEEVKEENNELTEENETLRSELDELTDRMNRFEQDLVSCCFESHNAPSNGAVSNKNPELGQNIPNPFSESTIIRYYLPDGTTNAIIRITDMEGSPVEDLQLGTQRGANQVEFQTQGLASGTYLYSLFVDGQFVDTKKMMIAR